MTGFVGGESSEVQFYVWFSILGLIQSICFPAFIHIVANWFPERRRGIAMCAFCSCVNIGDILGAQLGQALLSGFGSEWQWLFVILIVLYVVLAACIFIFLVQHPEHIGVVIEPDEIKDLIGQKIGTMKSTF